MELVTILETPTGEQREGFTEGFNNSTFLESILALCRMRANSYKDGQSEPRGGLSGSALPSARVISAALHHEPAHPNNVEREDGSPDSTASHMMMQFGQFLTHDISMTAREDIDCCHPNIIRQGK